jgi:hypothetical protein
MTCLQILLPILLFDISDMYDTRLVLVSFCSISFFGES